jgi:hypothetical protein
MLACLRRRRTPTDPLFAVSMARAAVMHGSWDEPGQHARFLEALDALNALDDHLRAQNRLALLRRKR